MTQESATRARAERNDRAQIDGWLLDYVALMEAELKHYANTLGLQRAVKNRRLQLQIKAVTDYLTGSAS